MSGEQITATQTSASPEDASTTVGQPIDKASDQRPAKRSGGAGCLLKGCLIVFVLGLSLVVLCAILIYGALKNVSNKTDLGVTGSVAGFETFADKVGLELEDIQYEDLCLTCPHLQYEGSHEVDLMITEEDASSWFQTVNVSPVHLTETQFKFNADGTAELSTYASYQGNQYPIYASGSVERSGEQSIFVNITNLKVGMLNLPDNAKSIASEFLTETGNAKLAAMTGLRIDTLRIEEGGVVFEGTVPDKASY